MEYILKSRKNGIFFEFMVHKNKSDTIILLSGFPSKNDYDEIMQFLYSKGFNVIYPRYPGMFESDGVFLEKGFFNKMSDFIFNIANSSVVSLWDNRIIKIRTRNIYLFSSSFSGAVSASVTSDNRVKKSVLFSPVLDYKSHNNKGNEQNLNHITSFVKKAYKYCIRCNVRNIQQILKNISELSPDYYQNYVRSKILIFHDPEDKSVSIKRSEKFCKDTGNDLVTHSLGHGMNLKIIKENFAKISDFINS